MTPSQQAQQLIQQHGFKAYDVATNHFNEHNANVTHADRDKGLEAAKQANYWICVCSQIVSLQYQ